MANTEILVIKQSQSKPLEHNSWNCKSYNRCTLYNEYIYNRDIVLSNDYLFATDLDTLVLLLHTRYTKHSFIKHTHISTLTADYFRLAYN